MFKLALARHFEGTWTSGSLEVPWSDRSAKITLGNVNRQVNPGSWVLFEKKMGLQIKAPLDIRTKRRPLTELESASVERLRQFTPCHVIVQNTYSGSYITVTTRKNNTDPEDFSDAIETRRLDELLALIKDVTDTMNATLMEPWKVLEAKGLKLSISNGHPVAFGKLEGVPIYIERDAHRTIGQVKPDFSTRIQVDIPSLKGLYVAHKKQVAHPLHLESVEINNPLVERLLRIAGKDKEAVRELFGNKAFVDALLPLIHGHPGSTLTDARLELIIEGQHPENLSETLEQISTVIETLKRFDHAVIPRENIMTDGQGTGKDGRYESNRAQSSPVPRRR